MDAADITSRVVAGAAAGDLVVTGIETGDQLILVQNITDTGVANLAAEFAVKADGTINNLGGTSTAGKSVLVMWRKCYHTRDKFSTAGDLRQGRSPF